MGNFKRSEIMKKSVLFFMLLFPLAGVPAEETPSDKEQEFRKTLALLESDQFKITATYAYSSGGRSIPLAGNEGTLTVRDSVAEGFFPFFGRAYRLPMGEEGGIRFDGKMEKKQITVKEKRKNSSVRYKFRVKGLNDVYDISIEAFGGDYCTVYIQSNNRSTISYQGKVEPLPEP